MAGTMKFWGVEVKSGESLEVKPTDGMVVHVSQASLGESKKNKSNESVHLHVTVDDKKLVLGKLLSEKIPHASFDLVFERPFTLSHNWKNGSVYFTGYKAEDPNHSDSEDSDSDNELRGRLPTLAPNSGTQTIKPNEDVKPTEEDDEDSDDESFDEEDDDDSDDEDMTIPGAESDEEDSDDSSDDESPEKIKETPKKAVSGKKRQSDSVQKTSVPDKKAKLITPQKTDGKKEAAVNREATPHPSKQAGKAGSNSDKSKQQTPKAGGSFQCKSCNRSFNSETGLESHSKAKHSSGK